MSNNKLLKLINAQEFYNDNHCCEFLRNNIPTTYTDELATEAIHRYAMLSNTEESRQMLIRYSMWLQEHVEQPYSTDHVDQFIRDDNRFCND